MLAEVSVGGACSEVFVGHLTTPRGFVTPAVVVVALGLVLFIVVPAVFAYRVVTLIPAEIGPVDAQ
ncbi:hypothetical protein [Nocardia fluminea]|uniref:hypothetical protein n=1 Tax=Nocardia fluminea TaxID=134984 RepID=UPI00343802D7